MQPSKKYKLNMEDMKKVGKGLLIAMAGTGLTYLAEVVGLIDFGSSTPLIVMVACGLVNFARKLLVGKK